jgi:hypothetical protein
MDLSSFQPVVLDKWLHVAQMGYAAVERRYIGRFGYNPKVIFVHIQEGNNWGSWQHFHVVTASSTVMIGKNGDIWRLVPESDAPWTNGDVQSPTAIGWEVINQWGADPNVYTLSIETEGFTGEDVPDAQFKSVVWQVWTWMQKYNIPLKYVLRHADVNSVTRPNCPGNAYYNRLIEELKTMSVTQEPVYVAPSKVFDAAGAEWSGASDLTINGALFHGDVRTVTLANDDTNFYKFATFQSAETRKPMNKGEQVSVIGWVTGAEKNGESRWWITKYYSRLFVGDTTEKPTAEPTPEPDVLPAGAKIFDGRVYYPTFAEDGSHRKVKTITKANLRAKPSVEAKNTGVVARDTELDVRFWTIGDAVKNERVWWLKYNGGNPFGGDLQHLWVAATIVRPT